MLSNQLVKTERNEDVTDDSIIELDSVLPRKNQKDTRPLIYRLARDATIVLHLSAALAPFLYAIVLVFEWFKSNYWDDKLDCS